MGMKKSILFGIGAVMMLIFTGCSSSDNDLDRDIDEGALLSQTEPLYKEYFSIDDLPHSEKTVGTWKFRMAGDYIREASFSFFGDASTYANAPASAEAFFEEYMPITQDNKLVLTDEHTSGGIPQKIYRQYYKGVEGPGFYQCFYQPDGKTLCSIQGSFTPIDNLDTNPRISENLARRIAQAYITKDAGEFKDYSMDSRLGIASFIKDGQTYVHLVYYCTYTKEGWSNVYGATIDAHTGRVLAYSMGIA